MAYLIGGELVVEGEVLELDMRRKLVESWSFRRDPELRAAYIAVSRLALRQARKDGRPASGAEAVSHILKENQ